MAQYMLVRRHNESALPEGGRVRERQNRLTQTQWITDSVNKPQILLECIMPNQRHIDIIID